SPRPDAPLRLVPGAPAPASHGTAPATMHAALTSLRPAAPGVPPSAPFRHAAAEMISARPPSGTASEFFTSLRVIGQAFEGYLICESGASLLVIDQHAAHERVTFERLRRAYSDGGVARQRLLVPVVVDVGAQAAPALSERLAELENLGFELEPF